MRDWIKRNLNVSIINYHKTTIQQLKKCIISGCCIFQKPLAFGESSSESEDECDHCSGHVEKRKSKKKSNSENGTPEHTAECDRPSNNNCDPPVTSS